MNMNQYKKIIIDVGRNLRHLWPYLITYKKWATLSVFFVLLKVGLMLIEPTIFRQIVVLFQEYNLGSITRTLAVQQALWLMVAFAILHGVVMIAFRGMFHSVNRLDSMIMRDSANDFVEKVLNLSFRFHSERQSGRLAKEFARGITAVETFLDAFIFSLIPLGVQLIAVAVIFSFLDWLLALVVMAMTVLFVLFTAWATLYMQKHREEANKTDDTSTAKALDALMNAEAVQYFQQEQYEVTTFRRMRGMWQQQKQKEWDGWIWIMIGQSAINVTAVGVILGTLIARLLQDVLTLGDFVLVITYITILIGMLWEFQHHFRRMNESLTDLNDFFRYYGESNEIVDVPNAGSLAATGGEVVFDNVSFGYGEKQILNGVSFTIPAGTSVAFVGPSGVGKSTIMKLLYRFYELDGGSIRIDGQDISQVSQQSLRAALGIVPQETALFNETIRYNIAYGASDKSEEAIQHAAQLAHANQLVEKLPKGYETLVGERGVKLSGGEKQRISIARAFLRDAPILILDEATASLDSASEAEIQEALKDLMRERTTLIIAHRLSTIMSADMIVVLCEGGVEQVGTHDELMQNEGGLYKRLWELQAGGYIE